MSSDNPEAMLFENINKLLGFDVFREVVPGDFYSPYLHPQLSKPAAKCWTIGFYDMETIETATALYCNGAPLENISAVLGMSFEEIDKMLDIIIPYL